MRLLPIIAISFALAIVACSEPGAQSADTIRQYQFAASGDGYDLVMREVPRPIAGPDEVLVRVHANALNRRDINMMNETIGQRGVNFDGLIPLSDGAGEVIEVGSNVTQYSVGDRVVGCVLYRLG